MNTAWDEYLVGLLAGEYPYRFVLVVQPGEPMIRKAGNGQMVVCAYQTVGKARQFAQKFGGLIWSTDRQAVVD